MAVTVPSRTGSTPLNSVSMRAAKASIDFNKPQTSDAPACVDFNVSLVFETLAEVGIDDKEAGYWMAMDKATVSRIKHGQQKLPIDALWRLPDRFWAVFHSRIGEAKGLTERHVLKVRASRIAELVQLLLEGVA